jgi:hypothetical protein
VCLHLRRHPCMRNRLYMLLLRQMR